MSPTATSSTARNVPSAISISVPRATQKPYSPPWYFIKSRLVSRCPKRKVDPLKKVRIPSCSLYVASSDGISDRILEMWLSSNSFDVRRRIRAVHFGIARH